MNGFPFNGIGVIRRFGYWVFMHLSRVLLRSMDPWFSSMHAATTDARHGQSYSHGNV